MNQNELSEQNKEKLHTKKLVAPIIIGIIMGVYYMLIVLVCILIPIPWWGKLLMVVIPLALAGVVIFVLVERINEIRSGEEDDLSKY